MSGAASRRQGRFSVEEVCKKRMRGAINSGSTVPLAGSSVPGVERAATSLSLPPHQSGPAGAKHPCLALCPHCSQRCVVTSVSKDGRHYGRHRTAAPVGKRFGHEWKNDKALRARVVLVKHDNFQED